MSTNKRDWIEKQYEERGYNAETKRELYASYNEYIEETGSTTTLDGYKRVVRQVLQDRTNNPADHIQREDYGNNTVYTYVGPRIMTVDQMLDILNVSEDDWNIDRAIVNKWETPRKNKEVDLTWVDGKMDGSVNDYGNMTVEPLFQVKIWLTKKILDKCSLPELQKVEIKTTKPLKLKPLPNKDNSVKTAVILADAQMGFIRNFKTGKLHPLHDRSVLSVAAQVIANEQPELIILNGDFFDFAELSDKFLNQPEFFYSIQPALIEFAWWMKEYKRISPNSRMIYLAGNHEDRLRRSIIRHSAFAHGLKTVDRLDGYDVLSIPNLAGFDDIGIEWVGDYKYNANYWLTDNFQVTHGTVASGKSGLTVKNMISDATYSKVVGHIHKFESAEKVIEDGGQRKEIQMYAFGTMCRIDGAVPSNVGFHNWQQGFGVIHFNPANLSVNPTVIPVKVNEGYSIYDRVMLQGSHESRLIAADTGWDSLDITDSEENFDHLYFK